MVLIQTTPSEVSKQCFKCLKVKPLEAFYEHPQMKDGHLNKCKLCTRGDVTTHYHNNRDKCIEYERTRRPKRKYQKPDPIKSKAHYTVSHALRSGWLIRGVCENCGCSNVEAHHDDYEKPLDVRWLCRKHHLEVHGKVPY